VYTVFAMGLAGGEPALMAIPSVDAMHGAMLPETGGVNISSLYALIALALGVLLIVGGFVLRRQLVRS
jgi:LPXTG-motif cell wall-anchored protein